MKAVKLNSKQAYSVVNSIVTKNKIDLNVVLDEKDNVIYLEYTASKSDLASKVLRLFSSRYKKNEQNIIDKDAYGMYLVNKDKVYYADTIISVREDDVLSDDDALSDILEDAIGAGSSSDSYNKWIPMITELQNNKVDLFNYITKSKVDEVADFLNELYDASKNPLKENFAVNFARKTANEVDDDEMLDIMNTIHQMLINANKIDNDLATNTAMQVKISNFVTKNQDQLKALKLLSLVDEGYVYSALTNIMERLSASIAENTEDEPVVDESKYERLKESYGVSDEVIAYLKRKCPGDDPLECMITLSDDVVRVAKYVKQNKFLHKRDSYNDRLITAVKRKVEKYLQENHTANNIDAIKTNVNLYVSNKGNLEIVKAYFQDVYDEAINDYMDTHPEPVPQDEIVVKQRQGFVDKIAEMEENGMRKNYIDTYEKDLLNTYREQLVILINDKAPEVIDEYKKLFLNN